ncbi:MAG: histidine kinase [Flavobacteriales bacterium]|nr:histidine kinase [Flavobacteriales bacterium]MCB9447277.1 histidine kinase [Flavobacteriales bacterium]
MSSTAWETKDSSLYIFPTGDNYVYQINNSGVSTFMIPEEMSGIKGILSDKNETHMVVTYSGHVARTKDFHHFTNTDYIPLSGNGRVTYWHNKMFFCIQNKIFSISGATGKSKLVHELPPGTEIIYCGIGPKDELFIGTRNGLGIFKLQADNILFKRWMLRGQPISGACTDRENGIWITSLHNGLYYIPNPNIWEMKTADGLPNNRLLSVKRDLTGRLWLTSVNSQYCIWSPGTPPECRELDSQIKNAVTNTYMADNGDVWVVGKNGVQTIGDGWSDRYMFGGDDFLIDHNGIAWLAGFKIARINKEDLKIMRQLALDATKPGFTVKPTHDVSVRITASSQRGWTICEDKHGRVWVGSDNTLLRWENNEMKDVSVIDERLRQRINILAYDSLHDEMWVGTNNAGLLCLHNDSVIASFSTDNGLVSLTVKSLRFSPQGCLWIGTDKGLNCLRRGKHTVDNLSVTVGIGNMNIIGIEVSDHTIYLATDNGLIYFRDSIDKHVSHPHPVLITGTRVQQQEINEAELSDLPHNRNAIGISFSSLNFRDMGNTVYRYRMKGAEDTWTTTNRTEVEYKYLAPGDYFFEITTLDMTGHPNPGIREIHIHIRPPVWATWWFRLGILCLIIPIGIFLWRRRLRTLQKRYELAQQAMEAEKARIQMEKSLMEIEQKARRMQMNPHFLFNALNTIKGFYAADKPDEAGEYITKLAQLLRMILDHTDHEIELEKELDILRLYIELMQERYQDRFDCEIHCEPDLKDALVPPMVLQPFVENAIIHGLIPRKSKGLLTIRFHKEADRIICRITDNGIGREASGKMQSDHTHQSHATRLTEDRLQLLRNLGMTNLELNIRDLEGTGGEPAGTEIIITLPYKTSWDL